MLVVTTVAGALFAASATSASAVPAGGRGGGEGSYVFQTTQLPDGETLVFDCGAGQVDETHSGTLTNAARRPVGEYRIDMCLTRGVDLPLSVATGTMTFTSAYGKKVRGEETKYTWSGEVTGVRMVPVQFGVHTVASKAIDVRMTSGTGPFERKAQLGHTVSVVFGRTKTMSFVPESHLTFTEQVTIR